jgi:membrane fusion protein, multidrug efflux system
MKNILIALSISFMIVACSSGTAGDKKGQLEELKKQQATLSAQISDLENELAKTEGDEGKSKVIAVTEMAPQEFNHYIDVQGKVDAEEDVMLTPKMAGSITRINVNPGDAVRQGQILAEIESGAMTNSVAEVRGAYDLAKTVYDRQKNLWDQKIGSEIQFLQAKNNKESAEKRLASMQDQLDMYRIKSPINGTVDAVDIKTGEIVAPGMRAIRVVNLSQLKVKAEVSETYATRVKKNDNVIISFPDIKKEIETKLTYSGKSIDPINRTFGVEIKLDPKKVDVRPNMIAIVKVADYTNKTAYVVPVNLIQTSKEGSYLYVAEGEKANALAKKKVVDTGMTYNGNIEIKSGIQQGDKVITTGYQDLIEGQKISF